MAKQREIGNQEVRHTGFDSSCSLLNSITICLRS
jgi:hypothetical protein